jgi:hypothetical protein
MSQTLTGARDRLEERFQLARTIDPSKIAVIISISMEGEQRRDQVSTRFNFQGLGSTDT